MMRLLSPRKTPAMSLHRASGQALLRFVEYREGKCRGPVRDVYLGLDGSARAIGRYEEEIREWVSRSLHVGWGPAGWQPATTGHEGVLTVEGLVAGYRRHLDEVWGVEWQRGEMSSEEVLEYRTALERGRELTREGRPRKLGQEVRWMGDRQLVRKGKLFVLEARRRYGHLDACIKRLWAAQVLQDLIDKFGPMSVAVIGDRELRRLRKAWDARGHSLSDRKSGMEVVRDAYCHVIGREARAPWDLDRSQLERNADRFGLDRGVVGPDGRWVRTH
ncbi:hypothetical protein SAMN05444166_7318 [Singulisphaera sp. GP187]|nr:hypothetical protein SAMN05444166_7318 [Singulisphaera sp. GP187]